MPSDSYRAIYRSSHNEIEGTAKVLDRKIIFYTDGQKELFAWDEFQVECVRRNHKVHVALTTSRDQELIFLDLNIEEKLKASMGLQVRSPFISYWSGKSATIYFVALAIALATVLGVNLFIRSQSKYLASFVSLEEEQKIGDEAFKKGLADLVVQLPDDVHRKWNMLTEQLTSLPEVKERPWRVLIMHTPEVNAMALPGHYIFFTTQLIHEAETADEILGVLAHEIAHTMRRHQIQAMQSVNFTSYVLKFTLGESALTAATYLDKLSKFKYSRAMESEADELGLEYLRQAQISPKGLLQFFDRLNRKSKTPSLAKWISTHPVHEERIAAIRSFLTKIESPRPTSEFIDLQELKAALPEKSALPNF